MQQGDEQSSDKTTWSEATPTTPATQALGVLATMALAGGTADWGLSTVNFRRPVPEYPGSPIAKKKKRKAQRRARKRNR